MSAGETASKPSTHKMGRKSRSRVSFVDSDKSESLTRLELIKLELEKMRLRDEENGRRYKEMKQHEIDKLKAQYQRDRAEKGVCLLPNVRESKQVIAECFQDELKDAMQEERTNLAAETARLKNEISLKYGLHIKKKNPNLVKLAEDFIQPAKASNEFGLPSRIMKELTVQEIRDLKQVFDLYDVAGVGFIRARDVKKIASILGFRANKEVLKAMLSELNKDHPGKISFSNFLEFIIKNQEGADPFDDIQQAFKMLDVEDKGYVTYQDLRTAADDLDCTLSNRMIREMVDEADTSGDGMISIDEFTIIMLRTSAFRSI